MHFQNRPVKGFQRVQQGHRSMAIGAGINNNRSCFSARLMHPFQQGAFMIGLAEIDFAISRSRRPAFCLYICQRFRTVDLRLTLAQQVQIGAVQDEDKMRHWLAACFAGKTRLFSVHYSKGSANFICFLPPPVCRQARQHSCVPQNWPVTGQFLCLA